MIKLNHILKENMRRFGTKNLNEQDQIKQDVLNPVKTKEEIKDSGDSTILKRDFLWYLIRKRPNGTYIIQIQTHSMRKEGKPFITPDYAPYIYLNDKNAKTDAESLNKPDNGVGYATSREALDKITKLTEPKSSSSPDYSSWSDEKKEKKKAEIKKKQDELQKEWDDLNK